MYQVLTQVPTSCVTSPSKDRLSTARLSLYEKWKHTKLPQRDVFEHCPMKNESTRLTPTYLLQVCTNILQNIYRHPIKYIIISSSIKLYNKNNNIKSFRLRCKFLKLFIKRNRIQRDDHLIIYIFICFN